MQRQKRRAQWEARESTSENGEYREFNEDEESDRNSRGRRSSGHGPGHDGRRWKQYSGSGPPRGVDREDALSLT